MTIEERLDAIERRLAGIERGQLPRLGPQPPSMAGIEKALELVTAQLSPPEPVDRSQIQLTTGEPVPPGRDHTAIEPGTGMQRGYIVLTPEERAKGFVQPVRRSYKHATCGAVTTMGLSLAETYARDPGFYSGTFCATCRAHFPLDQFTWDGTTQSLAQPVSAEKGD